MNLPSYFDVLPEVTLHDPLAALLGCPVDGLLTYGYADVVRMAGHSCPTVAAAWLMVGQGLAWIYGDERPVRGDIEVFLRDGRDHGVTGVIASVATLVTGAAADIGFPGIGAGASHARQGLLRFDAPIDGLMALRRRDSGAGVILDLDTGSVPHDPAVPRLMPQVLAGAASVAEAQRFAALWQDRVRRILVDHADDPKLVHVYDWDGPTGFDAIDDLRLERQA